MATFVSSGILVAVIFLYFLYRIWMKKSYKFPPGPKGVPFLGSLFDVSLNDAEVDFTALSRKYGDVFSVNMAGRRMVVLNSADAIREAFVSEENRDAFAGRPDNFYAKYCDRGPSTGFMDYGDIWREQRKFLVKTLKIFDHGDHSIENIIREEMTIVVDMINENKAEPFNFRDIVTPSLANMLFILITGKRYDYDHPAIRMALALQRPETQILASQTLNVLTMFPFLRYLPFGYGNLYREQQRLLENFLYYAYEIPRKTFDPSVTRGFIDNLFRLQAEHPWLKDDNIRGIVRETIGAGLATTRSMLRSFFLIILHRPEVMNKIQVEIDTVIGRTRPPRVVDRGQMPYTEAAMMEVQRYVTVVPLSAAHTTTRDVEFQGWTFPKDTLIIPNHWAVHHDEKVWGDPWVFRPERFLNVEGKLMPVDHSFRKNWLAFGVGRRACLGETFARSRIFLVITTLLQQFDFRPCVNEPLPSYDPREYEKGIVLHPPPFRVTAIERNV